MATTHPSIVDEAIEPLLPHWQVLLDVFQSCRHVRLFADIHVHLGFKDIQCLRFDEIRKIPGGDEAQLRPSTSGLLRLPENIVLGISIIPTSSG